MGRPALDLDYAAKVLAEAEFTTDRQAAAKFGIGERTIRNYRQRCEKSPELAEKLRAQNALRASKIRIASAQADLVWRHANQKALAAVLRRIEELAPTETDIVRLGKVADALSNSELTGDALHVEDNGADRQGATAQEVQGSGDGSAAIDPSEGEAAGATIQ